MKKKFLSVLSAVCLFCVLFSLPSRAAQDSGICGDNLSWTLSDGTLTISGTGDMYDFPSGCPFPSSYIKNIIVENGVTSIGDNAFAECQKLTDIIIPDGVKRVGEAAFIGCKALTGISFGSGIESIGEYAFLDCTGLTAIALPKSLTQIGEGAFFDCPLYHIYYEGTAEEWKQIDTGDYNDCLKTAVLHTNASEITLDFQVACNINKLSGECTVNVKASLPIEEGRVFGAFFDGDGNLLQVKILGFGGKSRTTLQTSVTAAERYLKIYYWSKDIKHLNCEYTEIDLSDIIS